MCGFSYVLKKRARLYELISYKGIRIAITVLFVLIMLFPSGYMMKMCVLLSGYGDMPGTAPSTYFQSLRDMPSNMGDMTIFPICKASSNRLSFGKAKPSSFSGPDKTPTVDNKDSASATTLDAPVMSTPSHFYSIFPGPYAGHISNSNMYATHHRIKGDQSSLSASPLTPTLAQEGQPQQGSSETKDGKTWSTLGSWAWIATYMDIIGSGELVNILLAPFANDRIWHFLLCRLQHLHLGFFLLGSASNVYMACKMLSDMYDLVVTPPHSRTIKNIFLIQASIFVIWFWFSYNLMAFRVSTTEEEFMSELPLWALRWINVGVAIVDLSYRRIYNRLGRLKVEEELLDISEVEKVEQMQQTALLHEQQWILQFGQEQGQYLLDQFMALEVKQSILNGANAAVDVVSDLACLCGQHDFDHHFHLFNARLHYYYCYYYYDYDYDYYFCELDILNVIFYYWTF
ncbi:hypothetical protein BGX31_001313 [Mortierella sp. GBA43]|nr:hypothetical protein BGX31_001313 [Mortierella sp. GBA43]